MMIPSSKISSVALTRETIEEFREIFLLADIDSSGVITKKELGKLFKTIGTNITEEELHSIVQSIDTDSNEEISFEGMHIFRILWKQADNDYIHCYLSLLFATAHK